MHTSKINGRQKASLVRPRERHYHDRAQNVWYVIDCPHNCPTIIEEFHELDGSEDGNYYETLIRFEVLGEKRSLTFDNAAYATHKGCLEDRETKGRNDNLSLRSKLLLVSARKVPIV